MLLAKGQLCSLPRIVATGLVETGFVEPQPEHCSKGFDAETVEPFSAAGKLLAAISFEFVQSFDDIGIAYRESSNRDLGIQGAKLFQGLGLAQSWRPV